jgi:hypothetical protein
VFVHFLCLHGGRERRLQRSDAGGVRSRRHRAGRLGARAPPFRPRGHSVSSAGRRAPAAVPAPPPSPGTRVHGRLLRHDALRPLQRATPGASPRRRAHRWRYRRRGDQGQQGSARHADAREVRPNPLISPLLFISGCPVQILPHGYVT